MNQEGGSKANLGGARERVSELALEAELVHDPAGLDAVGGAAAVEDEGLAHADNGVTAGAGRGRPQAADDAVLAGGLPVAGPGGAVRAQPRRVLAVAEAEEVPLVCAQLRHICIPPWPARRTISNRSISGR